MNEGKKCNVKIEVSTRGLTDCELNILELLLNEAMENFVEVCGMVESEVVERG